MLSFDEALERVLARAERLDTERVELSTAMGRVLAEPLLATRPMPAFDYSAMDGYAIDTRDLDGDPPFNLDVHGESRTGRLVRALTPGSACRIFTGAAIPDGANAVVMQEDVERQGDSASIRSAPTLGDHIRRAGEDLAIGALALDAGTRLGAYQLGLVAALDHEDVLVSRQPRVSILCTGDELRAPGSPDRPGSIPESNSIVIAALCRRAGATVRVSPPSGDEPDETRNKIAGALASSDVLVTVGGVSVGDHDVVRPALEAAGADLDFWKVAIRPGKPLVVGRAERTTVLGLPGNPVSAQVTFTLFGVALLRALQGDARPTPATRRLRLSKPIQQKPGRRGFYRGTLEDDLVTPLDGQSSGASTAMAWADALIVIPEDSTGASAGDWVDGYRLDDV